MLCAMIVGGFYGFIPGIAKAKLGANEIVSSLMLNYIAIELCNYLVRTQLVPPAVACSPPMTSPPPPSSPLSSPAPASISG
ncbi:hypothetical protein N8D56_14675 [Devosia sp. A8/3-2]|nr:hypothetical protein N8D56_14675 [Devosia sp. A8/3-2]